MLGLLCARFASLCAGVLVVFAVDGGVGTTLVELDDPRVGCPTDVDLADNKDPAVPGALSLLFANF
jgi:hypothetical protein